MVCVCSHGAIRVNLYVYAGAYMHLNVDEYILECSVFIWLYEHFYVICAKGQASVCMY